MSSKRDIAVVGVACRFPGAANPGQFWELLAHGRDAVSEIPPQRWSRDVYFHPARGQAGKSYTWAAGVIDEVGGFDAAFFGISPREARQMDPQQRLLLEVAWEALENAGLTAARMAGSRTGVYVGVSGPDYANLRLGDPAGGDAYFMTGITPSIVANRLSYVFDLHGPSFAVDTACSSSLVALHQACEALRSGEVPMAMVGGVNLLLSPYPFIGFCQASMLSPTGRCHAFDARADGYVRGEGAGVVILKPLADALVDGDPIRAVIRGTGVNSDGHTMGLSLPSEAAQAALLETVYARAGVAPRDLSFVEAHGTGTQAGDPIELHALGRILGRDRAVPLPIGSVKSNIGHLETASGMAGLIKAILAFEQRLLPPSLHFETPNPHIPFEKLGLEVVTAPRPLGAGELLAGINSFGFGGTNAHAVLASAPAAPPPVCAVPDQTLPPLLLSARSKEALEALARDWAGRLAGLTPGQAAPLLRAQARHRDHHRNRLYVTASEPAAMATALAQPSDTLAVPVPRVAFVYSGNGAQFAGMARDALAHSETFRAALARVETHLTPLLGWPVRQVLAAGDEQALRRTDIAQPLLFAVQVAITEALRARGIEAEAMFGHSVGEIAAAWAAGALSLETACRIVVARSHQQHRTEGMGGMAALGVEEGAAELGADIEIAAYNSRSNITVAGPRAALARLQEQAQTQGWRYTPLDLDYAFHSTLLDGIENDLLSELGAVDARDCGERFISTVTGETCAGSQLDAHYWWRNVRCPVLFRQAAAQAVARGIPILIEIGPHPILQSYLRDSLRAADADGRVLTTLRRQETAGDPFAEIAARCYAAGQNPSSHALFDGPCDIAGLPHYPWQREHFWFPVTSDAVSIANPVQEHPLLGARWDAAQGEWRQTLDLALQPWLADHAVEGMAVLPAAALLELVMAVAHLTAPGETLGVAELEIRQALALEEGRARTLRVRLEDAHTISIESRARLGEEAWAVHALARLAPDTGIRASVAAATPPVREVMEAEALYAHARKLGLDYGPHFRAVSRVDIFDRDNALAWLTPGSAGIAGYLLPPALIDGGLQAFLALLEPDGESTMLPWRMTGLRAFAPFGRVPRSARLTILRRGERSARGAIVFYDADGLAVAELAECWFRKVRLTQRQSVAECAFHFTFVAQPLPGSDDAPVMEPSLLLGAGGEAVAGDAALLFEAYAAAAAHQVLAGLVPLDEPFTVEDLIAHGVIAAEAAPLLSSLLALLARQGAASEDQWQWRLTAGDLPEPSLIWRTIAGEAPALGAELALAAAAAQSLPDFLRHGVSPVLPAALVEQMLYAGPNGRATADAMRGAVLALAARWPQGRPLRILEVGAGSGVLARQILDALATWPGTLDYVAAEADAAQAAKLAARFQNRPRVRAVCWDAASPPPGRFDLVLSAYGFSRGGFTDDHLSLLRRALVPNGLLLAVEPEPGTLWNWIFGQQAGWWRGSVAADFPIAPLKSAPGWQAELAAAGLVAPIDRALDGAAWPMNLIAARRAAESESLAINVPAHTLIAAAPRDARAQALAHHLMELGGQVTHLPLPVDTQAVVDCAASDIVVLPPSSFPADAVAATQGRLMAVLDVARAAAELPTRLWIVTENTQQPGPQAYQDAALWGLGRTIVNEMPSLDCRLVDAGTPPPQALALLLGRELTQDDGETEIVLLPQGRHVMRLARGAAPPADADGPVKLTAKMPGRLDSLEWEPQARRAPRDGEVAIDVRAVDVNFRDVMWSLDLLPEEALLDGYGGPTLGLACAGVVRALGAGVTGLRVGDAVLAIAPACFASAVIAARHTVVRLPAGLDFAAAATLPVAFVTVLYALGHLANLKAGETVLIHGGAGGVGLAAIQYAKHKGATVIVTAGSPAKWAFALQAGADHVLDSRDLTFVEGVKALTGGIGVDVVLNSLSGEAMEQSLGLLRPFGRFLELGKRDYFTGTRVGLKPLRRNISYFAVDVDALPLERPDLSVTLMTELMDLVASGALRPLPYRLFHRAEVGEAFRLMQAAGHIGKIILSMEELEAAHGPARKDVPLTVRDDGTYLVTGGLGGFGLATAQWLVRRGARSLALVGRRGAGTPGAADALAALTEAGVTVRAFAADIADGAAVAALLGEIRATMPPLRGVVHAAMVLEDGLLADLDAEKNMKVLAPKLGGANHLDRLTRGDALDFFLLYSSATTVLGAPGQGNYVAANSALEGLARQRRAQGLPAFAIGWGPIEDAGYLARHAETREVLARRLAANPMPAQAALDALPELMAGGEVSVAFASVRWDAARRMLPVLGAPVFQQVVDARVEAGESDLRERLAGLGPDDRKVLLLSVLREEIARILSSAAETLDADRPVSELGMDSLMAVELRLALEQRIGVNLPMFSLSPQTSLAQIAARLARDLAAPEAASDQIGAVALAVERYESADLADKTAAQ